MIGLTRELEAVRLCGMSVATGRVGSLRGLTLLVEDLALPIGSLVSVRDPSAGVRGDPLRVGIGQGRGVRALGEVVGFDGGRAIVMLLGESAGIRQGDLVAEEQQSQSVRVGDRLLGRVVDALGRPIDGKGPIDDAVARELHPRPIGAMERARIRRPLRTGVRAVDLMLTVGRGQRLGIFAGPGVGKSTLLGSIAKRTDADVSVIALIGERGREVREFIEDSLGEEGLRRSVVVAATSDESPLLRIRAARVACSVAEHFRDQGRHVLLIMDSVTRFAHAQRQVGLSVGEPPTTKGYTPSVFAQLPLLLERAGCVELAGGREGSVTGLYSVLVEGDDMTEPVADAARGILDGHVILSRKLAQRAHFPAIDVLDSVSRVADHVSDNGLSTARRHVRRLMAAYAEVEELIQIGAYVQGSDPEADVAVAFMPRIRALLQQDLAERADFSAAHAEMLKLSMESGELLRRAAKAGAARTGAG